MAASKIAHLLLDPAKALTMHSGLRSHQRDFTWDAFKHVAQNGVSIPHPEGNHKLLTEARDPQNPDTYWKVATDNNPVTKVLTVMKDTSRPFAATQALAKAKATEQGEAQARANKSKAARDAQKAKKQARSAAASNKQPKGKK
jgi:hypothetical protein